MTALSLENGYDPSEQSEGFTRTGSLLRTRPHQKKDSSRPPPSDLSSPLRRKGEVAAGEQCAVNDAAPASPSTSLESDPASSSRQPRPLLLSLIGRPDALSRFGPGGGRLAPDVLSRSWHLRSIHFRIMTQITGLMAALSIRPGVTLRHYEFPESQPGGNHSPPPEFTGRRDTNVTVAKVVNRSRGDFPLSARSFQKVNSLFNYLLRAGGWRSSA